MNEMTHRNKRTTTVTTTRWVSSNRTIDIDIQVTIQEFIVAFMQQWSREVSGINFVRNRLLISFMCLYRSLMH